MASSQESKTFHGHYNGSEYKAGEQNFRFLRDIMGFSDMVTVTFLWPDMADMRWVRVKGVVSRIFRDREVPYAELPFLEHDPDIFEMIGPIKSAIKEHPVLDNQAMESITNAFNFTLQADELAREAGIIPEGLYLDAQVQINLCHFPLIGLTMHGARLTDYIDTIVPS